MASLPELQAGFRAALLDGVEHAVAADIVPDRLGVPARLAVYRHHVFTSLTAALEATFPVVCRLVDQRFFGWLAHHFIRTHPPATPCLDDYGADLPGFIARFPACEGLPWLADVARLEWALNAALHAPEPAPRDPAWLARVPPAALEALVLRLDPSLTLLESPWPVDAVWRAHRPGADAEAAVDLAGGGVRLEVRRDGDDVVLRPLAAGTFAFRRALAGGLTLLDAVEAGVEADAAFDAAAEIRALVDECLLVAEAP